VKAIAMEMQAREQARQTEAAARKAEIEKIKAEQEGMKTGGAEKGLGEVLVKQQTPQDIAKAVGDQRAKNLEAELKAEWEPKLAEAQKYGREVVEFVERKIANIKNEVERERKRGMRDTMQGRATPEEIGQARIDNTAETLHAFEKQGQLSHAEATALFKTAQEIIKHEQDLDELTERTKRIEGLLDGAAQSGERRRAQRNSSR
jgi:hypothetical protein